MKKIAWVLIAVFLLASAVFGYRSYLVSELRKPVLAELSDPHSAQFQSERLFSNWTPSGSALCGEVNAKNRMGGYAGFQPFVAFPGYATVKSELQGERLSAALTSCDFEKVAPWWHLRW